MNVRDLVRARGGRERNLSTASESITPVISLHREMNRLFDDVFRGFEATPLWSGRNTWPSVDAEETNKAYRVTAELPGMEEGDIERTKRIPINADIKPH